LRIKNNTKWEFVKINTLLQPKYGRKTLPEHSYILKEKPLINADNNPIMVE